MVNDRSSLPNIFIIARSKRRVKEEFLVCPALRGIVGNTTMPGDVHRSRSINQGSFRRAAAIPILRVLSLYAWVVSIGYHVGDIYKAIGRPDILIKMSIPMFFVRVFLLWLGAQYSLVGVGIGHLVAMGIESVVRYFIAAHFLEITIRDIMKELTSFVCGGVLVVFALIALYYTAENTPIVQLVIVITAGAAGYLSTVWFIERNSVMRALQMLGLKFSTTQ
jgi:PST family polysaccharide transporter